jgi:putative copper export protein/methionine-rich copper-binding protein CopC
VRSHRRMGRGIILRDPFPTISIAQMTRRRSLLCSFALCLLAANPATAHTRLSGSAPASGDTVRAGVREIRLRFSAAPEASLTWLAVLRGSDTVAAGTTRPVDGSGGVEFVLPLADSLLSGDYRVAWRTAGADGHVLRGSFSFTVRLPATVAAVPAPAPSSQEPVVDEPASGSRLGPLVRWGWFLALLGMIGAPVFYGAVLDRMRRKGLHERVTARAAYGAWHVAAGAAALSLLTLVLRLWLQSAEMYGAGSALEGSRLAALLQTTGWGSAWTLQAIATFGFFLGLMVARAPHGRGAGWTGVGAAALLLSAVPALSGHAAAVEGPTALAIAVDTLHVLGAGAWLGTLAVLMGAGIPAALSSVDGGGPAVMADMIGHFSPVALAAGGVAGATGVANALFHLTAVSDLWGTGYGRTLALKLLLLAVVAAAGAYNWKRVRPSLGAEGGADRLRRSVTIELAAGALVILATAVLVALPTP